MATYICLLSSFCPFIILTCLSQSALSFLDIEELKSVYYGLDIINEPVMTTKDSPLGSVHVTSKFGQQYQCSFPDHEVEEKKKEEEERLAKETGIVEMLKPMAHGDCLFKTKDWWSYEFCYGKYIRQFHMEDGDIRGNIIYLGYYYDDFDWSNDTAKEERLKSRIQRYHSQRYILGTKCDLTGQPRQAEVRFICEENSEDYLARVDESQTCIYTVTVMTSRTCRHPDLKVPTRRKPVPITCQPLLSEEQYSDYMAELQEQKELEETAQDLKKQMSDLKDLDKRLEKEMSKTVKELLSQSGSDFFPTQKERMLSKEQYQRMYGNNEKDWELYVKRVEKEAERERHTMEKVKERIQKEKYFRKENEKEQEEEESEEDNEILSEFEDEIKEIQTKFVSSQKKLAGIKKRLVTERNWESQIENAIKEAEQELGVKVDRSLVSGLSNTLDKLVNKLQDTEAELTSMDKEIGKLKANQDQAEGETNADAIQGAEEDKEEKKKGEGVQELGEEKEEETTETEEKEKNLDEKILPPPKSKLKTELYVKTRDTMELQEHNLDENEEEPGVEVTTPAEKEEEEPVVEDVEGDESQLPSDVRKLLEETVRKEYDESSAGKPARFGEDHSFQRENTVHVIEQEDENGKTNRYIFVFGFSGANEESKEVQHQKTLEENYSYVYSGKKQKKSVTNS